MRASLLSRGGGSVVTAATLAAWLAADSLAAWTQKHCMHCGVEVAEVQTGVEIFVIGIVIHHNTCANVTAAPADRCFECPAGGNFHSSSC